MTKIEQIWEKWMELGQGSHTLCEGVIILFEYRLLEAKVEYYNSLAYTNF